MTRIFVRQDDILSTMLITKNWSVLFELKINLHTLTIPYFLSRILSQTQGENYDVGGYAGFFG